jgi:hypothetical protein
VPFNTLDDVRNEWADAPMDDVRLTRLLNAANEQILAFAPQLRPGQIVPARYAEAELLQVRALGQAMERDGDVLGFGDGFAVRVRPLGGDVRALLRPKKGRPRVG